MRTGADGKMDEWKESMKRLPRDERLVVLHIMEEIESVRGMRSSIDQKEVERVTTSVFSKAEALVKDANDRLEGIDKSLASVFHRFAVGVIDTQSYVVSSALVIGALCKLMGAKIEFRIRPEHKSRSGVLSEFGDGWVPISTANGEKFLFRVVKDGVPLLPLQSLLDDESAQAFVTWSKGLDGAIKRIGTIAEGPGAQEE